MPNYVTSRCQIFGSEAEVDRFRSMCIKTAPEGHSDAGGQMFDFAAIIPMPAILESVEESSCAEMGLRMIIMRAEQAASYADRREYWSQRVRQELAMVDSHAADVAAAYLSRHPEVEEAGRLRLQAILETGFASWYPWCTVNWGTKWGAFRFSEQDDGGDYSFKFETAWSFPTPIFTKLAELFPALSFCCQTFDEGSNFAGEGWFNPLGVAEPFAIGAATDALYERVYGHSRPADEVDEVDQ